MSKSTLLPGSGLTTHWSLSKCYVLKLKSVDTSGISFPKRSGWPFLVAFRKGTENLSFQTCDISGEQFWQSWLWLLGKDLMLLLLCMNCLCFKFPHPPTSHYLCPFDCPSLPTPHCTQLTFTIFLFLLLVRDPGIGREHNPRMYMAGWQSLPRD